MGRRLLVVDFDFFFPNPAEWGAVGSAEQALYDWQQDETFFQIGPVWTFHGANFLRAGRPLPRCVGYEGFWDRVRFTTASPSLLFADSNMYAGGVRPVDYGLGGPPWEGWEEVHLFDAHHDCGYPDRDGAVPTLEQWTARGSYSCEDWMVVHHLDGAGLRVTHPGWRPGGDPNPAVAPFIRQADDGAPVEGRFDAVFLCRSGAWVPAWCDDQFTDFLAAFPGTSAPVPSSGWAHPRPDVVPGAERLAALENQLMARATGQVQMSPLPASAQRHSPERGAGPPLSPDPARPAGPRAGGAG